MEMIRRIRNCPHCGSKLEFPKRAHPYCSSCKWPYEDKEGKYIYPKLGEQLGGYQPGLEYYNPPKWVPSGLISGRQNETHLGFYRKKIV